MTNTAETFLALQATDLEIRRAEQRLKDLPEKIEILAVRTKMKQMTELRAKAQLLVRKLEADLKARQDESAMIAEKLAAEQNKVMMTADHRHITALTREMDGLRRRVDKLDMESLQFMERIEKASAQVTTVEEHLAALADKDAELVSRYQAAGGSIQAEIATKTHQRAVHAGRLAAAELARYESVRDAKGGIGVGSLEGDTCTACRMSLPAERVRMLVDGPDVGLCPHCRRLLVVRVGSEK